MYIRKTFQAEAKQQLEELNKERQSQEIHHPSTSHENFNGMQVILSKVINYFLLKLKSSVRLTLRQLCI